MDSANPESKQEHADPSDRRLEAELLANRDELELDSKLTLDALELIASSKLVLLPFPLFHSSGFSPTSILCRNRSVLLFP